MENIKFMLHRGQLDSATGDMPWTGYTTDTPGVIIAPAPIMSERAAPIALCLEAGASPDRWVVVHQASGLRLGILESESKEAALAGAKRLNGITDWTEPSPIKVTNALGANSHNAITIDNLIHREPEPDDPTDALQRARGYHTLNTGHIGIVVGANFIECSECGKHAHLVGKGSTLVRHGPGVSTENIEPKDF